jgi:hypothetical protein
VWLSRNGDTARLHRTAITDRPATTGDLNPAHWSWSFAPPGFSFGVRLKNQTTKDLTTMTDLEPIARDKREYLLAELRAAALRARLWQADIDAVGLALKANLISFDQAI